MFGIDIMGIAAIIDRYWSPLCFSISRSINPTYPSSRETSRIKRKNNATNPDDECGQSYKSRGRRVVRPRQT